MLVCHTTIFSPPYFDFLDPSLGRQTARQQRQRGSQPARPGPAAAPITAPWRAAARLRRAAGQPDKRRDRIGGGPQGDEPTMPQRTEIQVAGPLIWCPGGRRHQETTADRRPQI